MLRPLIIAVILLLSGSSFSQTAETSPPQIWGDPDGFTGRDCETTMMLLDFVTIADRAGAKDQSIIIVARRGRGERSRTLSARRLKQVSVTWHVGFHETRLLRARVRQPPALPKLNFTSRAGCIP